jgi:cytochrome P450
MMAFPGLWRRVFAGPSLAASLDLGAPEIAWNPFPHYELLRRDGSVQSLPRHDAWIVLGYDDVQAAFGQPQVFSNRGYAGVDRVLLGADPPEHAAVRRVVSQDFSAEAVERVVGFAERRAESLLRPRMDVVSEYAMPLSASVAPQLLGLDDEKLDRILSVRRSEAPDHEVLFRAVDAVAADTAIYARLVREGMSEADARSVARLLWLAATMTTERAISHCVLRLLRHDEARDLAHVPAFVDEVLRLHPPELLVPRVTTQRVQLGGVRLPANATVYLCIAAANRDPAKFEAPAELRLDRAAVRIFTFGSGIHHCLGATVGRRVVQTAVRTLLTHAPRFRAAQRLEDLVGWCSKTACPIARLVIEDGR